MDYVDKLALANYIGKYFIQKVIHIHDKLDNISMAMEDMLDSETTIGEPPWFDSFNPLTEADMHMLIMNSKATSRSLKPMPTPLLMSCIDLLVPGITKIINISLEFFPKIEKRLWFVPC